jgi:hypothetical protein
MTVTRNYFDPRMISDERSLKCLRLHIIKTYPSTRNTIIVLRTTLPNSLEPQITLSMVLILILVYYVLDELRTIWRGHKTSHPPTR